MPETSGQTIKKSVAQPSTSAAAKLDEDWPKDYNVMRDDYTNEKFNQYSSGPGANLHLQFDKKTQQLVARTFLVFKNVPIKLGHIGIARLCERVAQVTRAHTDPNNESHVYIDFPTINDLTAAYTELHENEFGFLVEVGRTAEKDKQDKVDEFEDTMTRAAPVTDPQRSQSLSLNQRHYHVNTSYLPMRPTVKSVPILTAADYDNVTNLLQCNDPQRHFLIAHDAHDLERAQCDALQIAANDKRYFQTGRLIKIMSAQLLAKFQGHLQHSDGHYRPTQGVYRKDAETADLDSKMPQECANNCGLYGMLICKKCKQKCCSSKCHDAIAERLRTVCCKFRASAQTAAQALQMFRSGSEVLITAISSINLLYIRSKANEQRMEYVRTISRLQLHGSELVALKTAPTPGQLVVALHDKHYQRAMVLRQYNQSSKKYYVVYIDYGNIVLHALGELFHPHVSDEHFQKRFIWPVQLKSVQARNMTKAMRQCMYEYLGDTSLKLLYNAQDDWDAQTQRYNVQLLDESNNKTLNEMFITAFTPVPVPSTTRLYQHVYLDVVALPQGNNISLMIMDNSTLNVGFLSVAKPAHAAEIQQLQLDVQRYAEQLPAGHSCFNPSYNELCIAKYAADGKWYRAYGLESIGDGHPSVIFFDYGNIVPVSVTDIRPYAAELSQPIYTANCELLGLPYVCNADLDAELKKLLPVGCMIRCDQVQYHAESGTFQLTLHRIIQSLEEKGLIA